MTRTDYLQLECEKALCPVRSPSRTSPGARKWILKLVFVYKAKFTRFNCRQLMLLSAFEKNKIYLKKKKGGGGNKHE